MKKNGELWLLRRDKTQAYEIVPYAPKEIGEIYLGCKIIDKKKERILEIARSKYPESMIFQAEKHKANYELVFRELITDE